MRSADGMSAEYNPEMEAFETEQFESEAPWSGEVFSEAELMELAAEFLEVRDEAELDRFLGSLIKKAGQAIGQVVKSPIGKAVGGVLKGAAKQALPIAGTALGAYFGGPLGAKVGSGLASMAGKALGLELEGLSLEDREFEGAKQFVKFAGETVKSAVSAPPLADPRTAAKSAARTAAQQYIPGLLRPATVAASASSSGWQSPRWALAPPRSQHHHCQLLSGCSRFAEFRTVAVDQAKEDPMHDIDRTLHGIQPGNGVDAGSISSMVRRNGLAKLAKAASSMKPRRWS